MTLALVGCQSWEVQLKKTEDLNKYSSWVSHGESQESIFEYFFSGIKANESLIGFVI